MQNPNKPAADESLFAMWRAAIAAAHTDGPMGNSEQSLIMDYLACVAFTDVQMKQLEDDIRTPKPFEPFFTAISNPRHRAHLINFARILFHVDGEFSEAEEALWDEMHRRHMLTLDLKKIYKDAAAAVAKYHEEEKVKRALERQNEKLIGKALYFLQDF